MSERQRAAIERAAIDAGTCSAESDDAPMRCSTLLTHDALGAPTWIQLLPGTVNMTYPFADAPLERLRIASVRLPFGTELLEWEGGSFATFTTTSRSVGEVAYFVDRLFVELLGCDDDGYEIRAMLETLDP